MGGVHSRANATTVANIISNVISNDVQNCGFDVNAIQGLNMDGTGGVFSNNTMTQTITHRTSCSQAATRTGDLQNKIADQIKQFASTQSVALADLVGNSSSDVNTMIENTVANNITYNTIQNCVDAINASQVVHIGGKGNVAQNNTFTQSLTALVDCLSNTQEVINVANDVSNIIDQHAETKQENPLDFLAKIFGSITTLYVVLVVIIVVAVVVLLVANRDYIWAILGNSAEESEEESEEEAEPKTESKPKKHKDKKVTFEQATEVETEA